MIVGAGIMLSRLSGLVRELIFAGLLGTRVAADAFKAALQIPGLLQNILGEGTLSASFIPTYSRLIDGNEDKDGGRQRVHLFLCQNGRTATSAKRAQGFE